MREPVPPAVPAEEGVLSVECLCLGPHLPEACCVALRWLAAVQGDAIWGEGLLALDRKDERMICNCGGPASSNGHKENCPVEVGRHEREDNLIAQAIRIEELKLRAAAGPTNCNDCGHWLKSHDSLGCQSCNVKGETCQQKSTFSHQEEEKK